ncbi:MAG: hypothetical protein HYZ28_05275 [Myxococcales bacterium]|nr:hypothetical protein [Myxococcales bacterium]
MVRPHDFIVEEMCAFLRGSELAPRRLARLDELFGFHRGELAGAIISAAVSSSVQGSLREAFDAVRARFPTLPLAVSTLVSDGRRVAELLQPEIPPGVRLAILGDPASEALLGRADSVLVLRRSDILTENNGLARTALSQHFGPSARNVLDD